MAFEKPAVIIDNGSYHVKAGFACDNHPISIFRSLVGRPAHLLGSYGKQPYEVFVGEAAAAQRGSLGLASPVVEGRVVRWDDMERVWHHVYYRELRCAPEDRAVMLACSPVASLQEKIKTCEVLFEALNVPAVCIQPQSAVALLGAGLTTGLCVDIGYDTTDVVPVYEGACQKYAHMTTGVASAQLSQYIEDKLKARGYELGNDMHDVVEGIKQNCCLCLPQHDLSSLTEKRSLECPTGDCKKKYVLPDGEEIDVTEEACTAAELLFHVGGEPAGAGWRSLPDAVHTACLKCDPELRATMQRAVVPCGGLANLPGLAARLAADTRARTGADVHVVSCTETHSVCWRGAALLASLSEVTQIFVMRNEYDEEGIRVIRNRFL